MSEVENEKPVEEVKPVDQPDGAGAEQPTDPPPSSGDEQKSE